MNLTNRGNNITGKDFGVRESMDTGEFKDFSGSQFLAASATKRNFSSAKFYGCNISNSKFDECDFHYAILRGVILKDSEFLKSKFRCTDFAGATIDGSEFKGSSFWNSNFRGASISDTSLRDAEFTYCDMGRVSFVRVDFTGADLGRANIQDTVFYDCSGIIILNVSDKKREFFPIAVFSPGLVEDDWKIFSGCRTFSIQEALNHWGSPYYPNKKRGASYTRAIQAQLLV